MLSRGKRYVLCTTSFLLITSQSFSVHRLTPAGKRHLHSKCRCPTQHKPTNTKQSFMTCPILKRPADCTRPGPSRLSFTPKPRPKQCVGELEIPTPPQLPGPSFPAYESPPTAKRRVHWWGFTTLQDGSRRILPLVRLGERFYNADGEVGRNGDIRIGDNFFLEGKQCRPVIPVAWIITVPAIMEMT